MPILRSTHSSESALPVTMAISGMLPCAWVLGMSSVLSGTGFAAHALLMSNVKTRRQRPSWMTTVMALPAGTLLSVKLPSTAV